MSLYDNFEDVAVGDRVKVHRGRSRDFIAEVYHVTPKQFKVEGFGSFWKKNGRGVGDANSWYGKYAHHIERGDVARVRAETARINNRNLFSGHRVRDFNDDELARVAKVIRECNKRRNLEEEQYAEKQAATEAAGQ